MSRAAPRLRNSAKVNGRPEYRGCAFFSTGRTCSGCGSSGGGGGGGGGCCCCNTLLERAGRRLHEQLTSSSGRPGKMAGQPGSAKSSQNSLPQTKTTAITPAELLGEELKSLQYGPRTKTIVVD